MPKFSFIKYINNILCSFNIVKKKESDTSLTEDMTQKRQKFRVFFRGHRLKYVVISF